MKAAINAKQWTPLEVRYRPGGGQLVFHKDRDAVHERLLQTGTGGGKSLACAFETFDITLKERSSTFIIAAPDYPQLQLSVIPALERLFGLGKDHGRARIEDGGLEPYGAYNQTKKRIDWWNGWEWRFASMKDPTSVEGAPDVAGAWLNEARLCPGFNDPDGPWLNLTRRLRGEDDRRRRAFADTHSPTYGITEAFKPRGPAAVYDIPGPDGVGRLEVIDCVDPQRRAYQWGTMDAVAWGTLNRSDAERIVTKYSGPDRDRIILGRYARPTGVVYDAFTERNLQSWRKEKRPTRWTYGLDLGWTHPAVLTAHAWYGSSVHTIREKVLTRPGSKVIAEEVKNFQDAFGPGTVWVGYDVRAPEFVLELQSLGVPAEEFRGGVREGILQLNSRLQAGAWVIDPAGCPLLVDCLRDRYEWREGTREEPKKENDDAPDSARYGILGDSTDGGAGSW